MEMTESFYLKCVVTSCCSPQQFWAQIGYEETLNELESFEVKLKQYAVSVSRCKDLSLLKPDQCVLVECEEGWRRACVVIVANDEVDVQFVDYGGSEFVLHGQIVDHWPDWAHQMSPLAQQCKLLNVKPVSKQWSKTAVEEFTRLTSHVMLDCQLVGSDAASYVLDVYVEIGEDTLSLSEHLIEKGLALRCDVPASQKSAGGTSSSIASFDLANMKKLKKPADKTRPAEPDFEREFFTQGVDLQSGSYGTSDHDVGSSIAFQSVPNKTSSIANIREQMERTKEMRSQTSKLHVKDSFGSCPRKGNKFASKSGSSPHVSPAPPPHRSSSPSLDQLAEAHRRLHSQSPVQRSVGRGYGVRARSLNNSNENLSKQATGVGSVPRSSNEPGLIYSASTNASAVPHNNATHVAESTQSSGGKQEHVSKAVVRDYKSEKRRVSHRINEVLKKLTEEPSYFEAGTQHIRSLTQTGSPVGHGQGLSLVIELLLEAGVDQLDLYSDLVVRIITQLQGDEQFSSVLSELLWKQQSTYIKVANSQHAGRLRAAYCAFIGKLYLASQTWPDSSTVVAFVVGSVEKWSAFKSGMSVSVQTLYAECLCYLLEVVGSALVDLLPNEVKDCVNLRHKVMNESLPRTIREKLLDLFLKQQQQQQRRTMSPPPIQRYRTPTPPPMTSDVLTQTAALPTADSSTQTDLQEEYNSCAKKGQGDPYNKVKTMLDELHLQELLPVFTEHAIRDSVLQLPTEDLKMLLTECGLKLGQIMELIHATKRMQADATEQMLKRPLNLVGMTPVDQSTIAQTPTYQASSAQQDKTMRKSEEVTLMAPGQFISPPEKKEFVTKPPSRNLYDFHSLETASSDSAYTADIARYDMDSFLNNSVNINTTNDVSLPTRRQNSNSSLHGNFVNDVQERDRHGSNNSVRSERHDDQLTRDRYDHKPCSEANDFAYTKTSSPVSSPVNCNQTYIIKSETNPTSLPVQAPEKPQQNTMLKLSDIIVSSESRSYANIAASQKETKPVTAAPKPTKTVYRAPLNTTRRNRLSSEELEKKRGSNPDSLNSGLRTKDLSTNIKVAAEAKGPLIQPSSRSDDGSGERSRLADQVKDTSYGGAKLDSEWPSLNRKTPLASYFPPLNSPDSIGASAYLPPPAPSSDSNGMRLDDSRPADIAGNQIGDVRFSPKRRSCYLCKSPHHVSSECPTRTAKLFFHD